MNRPTNFKPAPVVLALALLAGCCTRPLPIAPERPLPTSAPPTILAPSSTVSLAWDAAVPSTEVVGYRIHWGLAPGPLTNAVTYGPSLAAILGPLTPGATYQFAATAFDAAGLESAPSNLAIYTVPTTTTNPATITIIGQWANTAGGPWTSYPVPVYRGPAPNGAKFFRLEITTQP